MKRLVSLVLLVQGLFVASADAYNMSSMLEAGKEIERIEYDATRCKKEEHCLSEMEIDNSGKYRSLYLKATAFSLLCLKRIPVRIVFKDREHEYVTDATIVFSVNQNLVIRNNVLCLNILNIDFEENKEFETTKWYAKGGISSALRAPFYAEIIFVDEERAQLFKESIDIKCLGNAGGLGQALICHEAQSTYKYMLLFGLYVFVCYKVSQTWHFKHAVRCLAADLR
jgi:hypothetical protein